MTNAAENFDECYFVVQLKIVTNCPTLFSKHKGVNKMSVGFLGAPSIKQLFVLQDGSKFPSNLLSFA